MQPQQLFEGVCVDAAALFFVYKIYCDASIQLWQCFPGWPQNSPGAVLLVTA